MLTEGAPAARAAAAGALAALALTEEIAVKTCEEGAIPPAMALLKDGSDEHKVEAGKFFMSLTEHRGLRNAAVKAGLVVPILSLLAKGTPQGRARAACCVRNLAKDEAHAEAMEIAIPAAAKPGAGGVQSLKDAVQKWSAGF
eukprot:TRINITY_DN19586_c0_g1_i1.p3 TRINITY_DN19586_c0_g1~~TRINITY_DN19586_c0_g1_i1.p3  ORF type:complete len:142 (-),score=49.10 TRINITY_DN19586_c0_g1_i1:119-544(-)